MAIPSRQIGWSTTANLLWQISKQLEYLTCVTSGGCITTTTTTTLVPTVLVYNVGQPVSMTYPAVSMYCNGSQVSYQYVNEYGPFESTAAIVDALNGSEGTSSTGVYVNLGDGNIQLTVPGDQVLNLCGPDGTLSFTVQPD